jgi:hypothetical protein
MRVSAALGPIGQAARKVEGLAYVSRLGVEPALLATAG